MKQLDFSASTPYDCQKNYNVLKSVINKLKLPLVHSFYSRIIDLEY